MISSKFALVSTKLNTVKKFYLLALISGICILQVFPQDDLRMKGLQAITEEVVKQQLFFLSSDWMQGRATGTEGEYMAGDYIASMLGIYGIKPAGDFAEPVRTGRNSFSGRQRERSFFQKLNLIEYQPGTIQELSFYDKKKGTVIPLTWKTDFDAETGDLPADIKASVVFVGYGLAMDSVGYNDFSGMDVRGKIILRLPGYPGSHDTSTTAWKKFHPRDRYGEYMLNRAKNATAKKLGARGIMEVSFANDFSDNWAANIPFRYQNRFYEGKDDPNEFYRHRMKIPGDTLDPDPPVIMLSRRALNYLLSAAGIDPISVRNQITASLKPASRDISSQTVHLKTTVSSRIVKARNVLGWIEGEDTTRVIVIGAHYDHIGTWNGYIFNGADDNASGTVAVMTLARAFAASGIRPKYSIVFAAWTGEEKGLLGSYYYVAHPFRPIDKTLLYVNFDMISRNSPDDSLRNQCTMSYTKAYKTLEDVASEKVSEARLGLNVAYRPSEKPRGGSDHTPFAEKNVPIIYFMAGWHDEYHTPYDQAEKADIRKTTEIIRLAYLTIWDLAAGKEIRR